MSLVPFGSSQRTGAHSFRAKQFDRAAYIERSIQRTLDLKANYLVDITRAVSLVTCDVQVPELLRAHWKDILTDNFVDFGKVYQHIYASDGEQRGTIGKLGDYEFILDKPSKSNRQITTHSEWSIAFKSWFNAVTFAYPHRKRELGEFETHIVGLFTTLPGASSDIIRYDRAVRVHAASRNDVYLGEPNKYSHLYLRHIINRNGGGSAPTAGPSRKNGRPSLESRIGGTAGGKRDPTEACIRWNKGDCTRTNRVATHALAERSGSR